MSRTKNNLLAEVAEEIGATKASLPRANTPALGVLNSRNAMLAKVAQGKVVHTKTEFVDPDRCRPWRRHNRDTGHLNEDNCGELIQAMLAAKQQRVPAIVRRLKDDPDHDFEIVAGVRRWWAVKWLRANHHPEFEYLITPHALTDEEAFIVSDIENRARKDITDWERAKDYASAIEEFFKGQQSDFADHLHISKSYLTRILDVARMPDEVVQAFRSSHDITVQIARELKPLLADDARRLRMFAASLELARLPIEQRPSNPRDIAKALKTAAEARAVKTAENKQSVIEDASGTPLVLYTRSRKGLDIHIPSNQMTSTVTLQEAIRQILTQIATN